MELFLRCLTLLFSVYGRHSLKLIPLNTTHGFRKLGSYTAWSATIPLGELVCELHIL